MFCIASSHTQHPSLPRWLLACSGGCDGIARSAWVVYESKDKAEAAKQKLNNFEVVHPEDHLVSQSQFS